MPSDNKFWTTQQLPQKPFIRAYHAKRSSHPIPQWWRCRLASYRWTNATKQAKKKFDTLWLRYGNSCENCPACMLSFGLRFHRLSLNTYKLEADRWCGVVTILRWFDAISMHRSSSTTREQPPARTRNELQFALVSIGDALTERWSSFDGTFPSMTENESKRFMWLGKSFIGNRIKVWWRGYIQDFFFWVEVEAFCWIELQIYQ